MVSPGHINSSPRDAAYMCQWTGSALVQVMACRLSGAIRLLAVALAPRNFQKKNPVKYSLQWRHNERDGVSNN